MSLTNSQSEGRRRISARGRSFKPLYAAAVAFTTMLAATVPVQAETDLAKKFSPYAKDATQTVDHSAWDQILKAHITADTTGLNRFDYGKLKAGDHDKLKAYVAQLEAVDPATLNRPEQFAYWANLYNAKTIDIVVDHYPVGSIREISINEGLFGFLKKSAGLAGPWKTPVVTVSGEKLSLDNVEHDIMRKIFKDPRVHYAVNCASIGCPNLNKNALTGENLEAELEKGAVAFINTPRGVDVDASGNVTASSIYSWFQVDFGGTEASVLDHVRKYAKPELLTRLEGRTDIASFEYDWTLNDIEKQVQ